MIMLPILLILVLSVVPPVVADAHRSSPQPHHPAHDPYYRPRASHMVKQRHPGRQAGMDVECVMRSIAYDMAMRISTARRHSKALLESLQASDCPNWKSTTGKIQDRTHSIPIEEIASNSTSCCPCDQPTIYVDCERGNDDIYSQGTCVDRPLQTLERAQQVIRQLRSSQHFLPEATVTVYIRDGICQLAETFWLTESNTVWRAFPNERPILSGGKLLTNLTWSHYTDHILVADLPPYINASAVDGLFTFPKKKNSSDTTMQAQHFGRISSQIRLTRARYPNGNSEVDRMPTNYDKLAGPVSSVEAWRAAGNVSIRFPGIEKKNSSFYPWFGHSRDVRWVQDYHLENASSYYGTRQQFWQPHIATAASYHFNASSNPYQHNPPSPLSWGKGDAILHVIHYNWWGNWQWDVAGTRIQGPEMNDTQDQRIILDLGKGGWQDAHGGAVSHNYFFIENVLEELDTEGEFYVDKVHRKLYYWPLPSQRERMLEWAFVATQLPIIIGIGGMRRNRTSQNLSGHHRPLPVSDVVIEGITFAHSTTTFLHDRYTVPSAGDWSVSPKGAVTIQNAVNVKLESCSWLQVNGNGVALHGLVHNATVMKGDFIKVGDSGVVSVGRLPKLTPYDGVGTCSAFVPTNITISHCHFGQTGVYGKQTSALFVALSKGIQFLDNALYDGPRAGVNINDGFGGGHRIARNVIFNQVLESGDHGPINTWSRSAYMQEISTKESAQTVYPAWNYIYRNFLMIGPKFGALYGPGNGPCSNGDPQFSCPKNGGSLFSCLDHDDGSEYYLDTRNVCAFAGMKNYIGQNKIWDSNLLLFPEGAKSQNRSGTSCIWTSMDMAGNQAKLPCSTRPCHTQEVYTNNTCVTTSESPLEYDMFNETDLAMSGIRNTTIPYTARNRYFLKDPYHFRGRWNLSETQARGIDVGSTEYSLHHLSIDRIDSLVRSLLDLPVDRTLKTQAID
jgi:hypothetical protein